MDYCGHSRDFFNGTSCRILTDSPSFEGTIHGLWLSPDMAVTVNVLALCLWFPSCYICRIEIRVSFLPWVEGLNELTYTQCDFWQLPSPPSPSLSSSSAAVFSNMCISTWHKRSVPVCRCCEFLLTSKFFLLTHSLWSLSRQQPPAAHPDSSRWCSCLSLCSHRSIYCSIFPLCFDGFLACSIWVISTLSHWFLCPGPWLSLNVPWSMKEAEQALGFYIQPVAHGSEWAVTLEWFEIGISSTSLMIFCAHNSGTHG